MPPRGKNVHNYELLKDIFKKGLERDKNTAQVKAMRSNFNDVKNSTFSSWLLTDNYSTSES